MAVLGAILASAGVAIIVGLIQHRYSNIRTTPWYVTASVYITWYLCCAVVVLLPMDISSTLYTNCLQSENVVFPTFTAKPSATTWAPALSSTTVLATPTQSVSSTYNPTASNIRQRRDDPPQSSSLSTSASPTSSLVPPASPTSTIVAPDTDPSVGNTTTAELLSSSTTIVPQVSSTTDAVHGSASHTELDTETVTPTPTFTANGTDPANKTSAPTGSSSPFVPTPASSKCEEPWTYIGSNILVFVWKVIYWSSQLLTWVILPVLQTYVDCGDFTFWQKMRTSIKENLLIYLSVGLIFGGFFIYLIAAGKLTMSSVMGIAIAASNTWGLFLLIVLMGVGLVEIPRAIFDHWRTEYRLRHEQFTASKLRAEWDEEEADMEEVMRDVSRTADRVPFHDSLRVYVDEILMKATANGFGHLIRTSRPLGASASAGDDGKSRRTVADDDDPITLKSLTALHRRVLRGCKNLKRIEAQWRQCVDHAFELEEILANKQTAGWRFRRTLSPPRRTFLAPVIEFFERVWLVNLRPLLSLAVWFVLSVMSVVIIWSEVTFWCNSPRLSILAIVMDKIQTLHLYFQVEILSIIFLAYMCLTSYSTLFRIRFFNFYHLVPLQQTDDSSLCFSALFLSRLTVPLGLNFLSASHLNVASDSLNTQTAFVQIMGTQDVVAFIDKGFNVYFPICTLVFAVTAYFHACARFLSYLGFSTYIDDTQATDQINEGKQLLSRERRTRERALKDPEASSENSLSSRRFGLGKDRDREDRAAVRVSRAEATGTSERDYDRSDRTGDRKPKGSGSRFVKLRDDYDDGASSVADSVDMSGRSGRDSGAGPSTLATRGEEPSKAKKSFGGGFFSRFGFGKKGSDRDQAIELLSAVEDEPVLGHDNDIVDDNLNVRIDVDDFIGGKARDTSFDYDSRASRRSRPEPSTRRRFDDDDDQGSSSGWDTSSRRRAGRDADSDSNWDRRATGSSRRSGAPRNLFDDV